MSLSFQSIHGQNDWDKHKYETKANARFYWANMTIDFSIQILVSQKDTWDVLLKQ